MSYSIWLTEKECPHCGHEEELHEISVTYNYARHFWFRDLDKMEASASIPLLEAAVAKLGTDRSTDYWEPTHGNAGYVCSILLDWAKANPGAVWGVH